MKYNSVVEYCNAQKLLNGLIKIGEIGSKKNKRMKYK